MTHYANAVRAEPGVCSRMVRRGPGYRVDTPTDCLELVQWVGRAMVVRKRMRLWSLGWHVVGLDDVDPVGRDSPLQSDAGEGAGALDATTP